MIKFVSTIFAIAFFLFGCSPEPITSTVTTSMLSHRLKDTTDKLTASIDRATINSDYLLEKNLRRIELIGHTLASRLETEIGTNREFVSIELSEAMTKLSELVDQAQGGVLELEDFFVLDTQRVINQIPLKPDEFLVRRFDGYSVKHQTSGAYEFRVLGNAFDPGNRYNLTVNGVAIDPSNIYGGASANTLRFTVPVEILNKHFSNSSVNRAKFKLEAYKPNNDKSFFQFNSHILLLPTHPVRYQLVETKKTFKWSGETSSKICNRDLGPSGGNGVWTQGSMSCSVDNPENERFTREKRRWTTGSHSRVDPVQFNGGKTVATSTCHNQCHDCPRSCLWELGVENKDFFSDDFSLPLKTLSLSSLAPISTGKGLFIPYGTYSARISKKYETFTLSAEYFNGRQVVLHPQKLSEYGVRVSVDSDDSANANFKRLIVEIKDGSFGT